MTNPTVEPIPFWIYKFLQASTKNVLGLVFSGFCFMHHGLALLDAFWSDQKRQESMFVEGFLEAMPMQIVKFCEMFF